MYSALLEAGQIVDEMFSHGIKSYRVDVSEANRDIIVELQAACYGYPGMLSWSVLGSVNSSIAYFTLHNKMVPDPAGPGGKVIEVNFGARKVLSRAA